MTLGELEIIEKEAHAKLMGLYHQRDQENLRVAEKFEGRIAQANEERMAAHHAVLEETSRLARDRIRGIAKTLKKTMRCNCDSDNWEPEQSTGHSHVCRIHKAAIQMHNNPSPRPEE